MRTTALLAALLIAGAAHAADVKVSALTSGGTIQTTDAVPVARAGASFRVAVKALATKDQADLTADVTGVLPKANGGTGTATPGLVAGTNVTVTGSWPNQTVNASASGGTGYSTSAFASLPSASTAGAGTVYLVTDVGSGGTLFVSNGTIWRPVGGSCILAQSYVQASVTGTITETALATVTVPAGIMTANGMLEVTALWSTTSSANNKRLRVHFSGIGGTAYYDNTLTTGAVGSPTTTRIANRNATNSQVGLAAANLGYLSSGNALTTSTVDTTAATTIVFTGALTNTGETIGLEGYSVRLVVP